MDESRPASDTVRKGLKAMVRMFKDKDGSTRNSYLGTITAYTIWTMYTRPGVRLIYSSGQVRLNQWLGHKCALSA